MEKQWADMTTAEKNAEAQRRGMAVASGTKFEVWAPRTAGTDSVCVGSYPLLNEARAKAATFRDRGDLRHQDVEIRRDGQMIEFAGPPR